MGFGLTTEKVSDLQNLFQIREFLVFEIHALLLMPVSPNLLIAMAVSEMKKN